MDVSGIGALAADLMGDLEDEAGEVQEVGIVVVGSGEEGTWTLVRAATPLRHRLVGLFDEAADVARSGDAVE